MRASRACFQVRVATPESLAARWVRAIWTLSTGWRTDLFTQTFTDSGRFLPSTSLLYMQSTIEPVVGSGL